MKLYFHHIGQTHGTQDLEKTVYRDIPISEIERAIPNDDPYRDPLITALRSNFPEALVNAWGAPEGADPIIKHLAVGDAVLLVEQASEYGEVPVLCLVEVYSHHKLPSLSEELWGSSHFPYIFFFHTRRIDLRWREMLRHLNYGERFNPRGTFRSVSETALRSVGGPQGYVDYLLSKEPSDALAFAPVIIAELEGLKIEKDLSTHDINKELAELRANLSEEPLLTAGLSSEPIVTNSIPRIAAFRIATRRLYGNACAICGVGLLGPNGELEVEAAHLYPKHLDGSDDVRNGICLCRRHHWAFDVGWMSLDDDLKILVRDNLPDGEEYDFIREHAGNQLRDPEDDECAPHSLFLREHRALYGF